MTFTSPIPDVAIPELALSPFVLAEAASRGDRSAFVDSATGRTMSYAELDDEVRRLAGGLLAAGLAKGEVLAIMAPNSPEYGVVFHAVAMAGGVVTTINPTYTDGEVHHQLVDAGATRLVTVPMFLEVATKAMQDTGVKELFVIGEADGVASLSSLYGDALAEQVPVDLDDVVVLPYSSGTTGLSKGVMLTHRNLVANIAQSQAVIDLDDDESFVAVLPFFHIYGMQVLMNMGLAAGATIVTMPRFDLEQFLALHQEHGLTRAFVAPPMVVALAKHPLVDQYDLSALRMVFSGAAPLSAELALECGARLDCEVVQGYGMTELSPVTHATPAGGFVPGSVGVTIPNTELRIVDPTGADLGLGEDGEVWVRGPQVMKGYLNNEAATSSPSTTTGGSTRATSATWTRPGTCSWSTGSRSSSSTRASRCRPPSSRRCCSRIPRSPMPPSSVCPTTRPVRSRPPTSCSRRTPTRRPRTSKRSWPARSRATSRSGSSPSSTPSRSRRPGKILRRLLRDNP